VEDSSWFGCPEPGETPVYSKRKRKFANEIVNEVKYTDCLEFQVPDIQVVATWNVKKYAFGVNKPVL
jgi:hypothetical protein